MGLLDELHVDILQLIAEKIVDHADILRFGAVCRKFRSIVMDSLHLLPPKLPLCHCILPNKRPPIPLLMQCHDDKWENINFFSISDGKNYGELLVPEIRNKWLIGSNHGWLCTVDIQGRGIQLLNPLTRAQIPLPSLDAFQHPTVGFIDGDVSDFGFIDKVVILSDPSNKRRNFNNEDDDRLLAMAIMSNYCMLSFCMLGDDKWTNVEDSLIHIQDIICYKDQIYAINYLGIASVFDFAGDKTMKQIANAPKPWIGDHTYLVESTCGDLLLVARELSYSNAENHEDDEGCSTTTDFVVYKLEAVDKPVKSEGATYATINSRDPNRGELKIIVKVPNRGEFKFKWVEMESLGDQALFLGKNYSICVQAIDYQGCKPNCIYFTEHGLIGHTIIARGKLEDVRENYSICDMGIYDYGDKSFEEFTELNLEYLVPPIWISPNPW